MTPTPEDIAWAAGLFEGEGSLIVHRRRGRSPAQYSARVVLGSTDHDVLRKFRDIVGVGQIGRPRRLTVSEFTGRPHKPMRYWAATNAPDVIVVTKMLMPWLGERRRAKAEEVLWAAWLIVGRTVVRKAKAMSDQQAMEYQVPGETMRMLARCLGEEVPPDDDDVIDAAEPMLALREALGE